MNNMRISVTDKFLFDVYNILEGAGDVANYILNARKYYQLIPGMEDPIFKKYRHNKNKRTFSNLVYYLKKKGYIEIRNLKNKKAVILTKDGIDRAIKASFKFGDDRKRKDGKWVMLIFDIPENRRHLRALLRSILHNLGFKILQKSVWISPYDISEKIETYLAFYKLDDYVKIFLVEGV